MKHLGISGVPVKWPPVKDPQIEAQIKFLQDTEAMHKQSPLHAITHADGMMINAEIAEIIRHLREDGDKIIVDSVNLDE